MPGQRAGDAQRRPARAVRGAVRVHLGGQQQRLGVRRHHGEHHLVQHRARVCDAAGPVPADHVRARPGRLAGPAAAGARSRPARCRPTGRCSSAWWSASSSSWSPSPSSPRSRSARWRKASTMTASTVDIRPVGQPAVTPEPGAPRRISGGLLDPTQLWRSSPDALRKLEPAHAVAQPGHVHRRDRRGLHHRAGGRRPVRVRLADHGLAVADRAVRQPGRGGGRGPRQGAGRDAAPGQDATPSPAG